MQNTLLGLAIAFILALTAALVGPYFVDWTRFRPGFETEASRIVGLPVRVKGDMVARLLPTPTLRLRDVEIGAAGEGRRMRADELDVAFNLGSLMRGEWRAEELAVKGVDAELGLDLRGQMNSFATSSGFNLGALAIDRVDIAGKLTLRDAASRTQLVLDDIRFSGDVRSLAGSIRGEGSFAWQGTRYPYRLSSGQTVDNRGVRVRFSVDPGDRLVMADADGVLLFEDGAPRFEGNVALGRPVGLKAAQGQADASLQSPWRLTAKVKAEPLEAKFEQVDILYGSDDAGLRLGGLAEMRFGASPSLQTVLAARQFDADRLLTQRGAEGPPLRLLQSLATSLGALPRPPMPVRADVSADSLTLGGRLLQGIGLDLRGDAGGWSIERLEFRAPGASRVALSGRLDQSGGAGFKGTAGFDASDPDLMFAWLQGRSDVTRPGRTLRGNGDITLAADRFAVDRLRLEMDGGTVEGRVAFAGAATGAKSRLDADLKADRFDLDTVMRIASGATGMGVWPAEAHVALDVGRATLLGQEARGINARLAYDDKAWRLERVAIADLGGATLDGSGTIDRGAAGGRIALAANAPSLEKLAVLVAPLSPMLASRLRAVPDRSAAAGLKVALQVERPSSAQASAGVTVEMTGPVAGTLTATAAPPAAALQALDRAALMKTPVSVTAKWTAPRAETLTALLGLERMVATRAGGGELSLSASGPVSGSLRTMMALKAEGLELSGEGSVNPVAATGDLDLKVERANVAPLFGLARLDNPALDLTLRARVAHDGLDTKFENMSATLGAARLRGRVVASGPEAVLDGEVGVDALDVGSFLRLAIGDAGASPSEPLSNGLIGRWRGRIAFQALGARLGERIELRPLSGVAQSDGAALTFSALSGALGGGKVTGDLVARPAGDALTLDGRLQLANVDGTTLRIGQLAMPAGRVSGQIALQGTGRSVATLAGSLSGNGTLTLGGAQLSGLDPLAFEAAIRASDQGVRDAGRIREVVERALRTAPLALPAADFPVTVRAGRARIDNTTLTAGPVQLAVSGGYDLTAGEIDLRTSLVSTVSVASAAAGRPEIRVILRGAAEAPSREVDVAPLVGWLAVRAIERETQRLDQLDRNAPPMGGSEPVITSTTPPPANAPEAVPAPPSVMAPPQQPRPQPKRVAPLPTPAPTVQADPAPGALPSLPPPIDVRPPPGGVTKRPAAPRPPTQLTPNASRPQNQSAF